MGGVKTGVHCLIGHYPFLVKNTIQERQVPDVSIRPNKLNNTTESDGLNSKKQRHRQVLYR